jgi:anti-sigma factor (TIGR02949 family)
MSGHAHDMKCEEVLKHLLEYLDREVDAQTAAAMSRHLEDCRGCFSRAEFELKLKQSLQDSGKRTASERLRARIKDLIDKF